MRSPSIRPALLVLIALALAAPTLVNLTEGAISAASAGEHLAGAIIVAWVGVSIVGHMVDSYRAAVIRRQHRRHPAPH
jgi:membrane protease YdiL (CAAX protease family)